MGIRTYEFLAARPGGFMNWPGHEVTSHARIRTVAVWMFRKWFGCEPSSSWGVDGFMAEAKDHRGNRVEIWQQNHAAKVSS